MPVAVPDHFRAGLARVSIVVWMIENGLILAGMGPFSAPMVKFSPSDLLSTAR
jgi:hypothetical protein